MTRKENTVPTLAPQTKLTPSARSREDAPRSRIPEGVHAHLASRGYGGFVCAECLQFFFPEFESENEREMPMGSTQNDDGKDAQLAKGAETRDHSASPRRLQDNPQPALSSTGLPSCPPELNMCLLFYSRRLRDALEARRLLAVHLQPLLCSRKRLRAQPGDGQDYHRPGPHGKRQTDCGFEGEMFLLSASQSRALLGGEEAGLCEACSVKSTTRNNRKDSTFSDHNRCFVSEKDAGAWLSQSTRSCPRNCASASFPVLLTSLPVLSSPAFPSAGSSVRARKAEAARSRVFLDLHRKGFFVRDGLAYGGDWLLYPLSPSLCHATALVFVMVAPENRDCSLPRGCYSGSNREGASAISIQVSCLSRPRLDSEAQGSKHSPVGDEADSKDRRVADVPFECTGLDAFSIAPASLVRMHRLATAAKKAAILALVELGSGEPLYIQLDRIKED
uniref:tRNA-intron lyase n=1 Tax=Neospora caninum (strain Liverpool) TaxID=572307 RepID=A0A0F7UDG3_NEOCL|nr:TPA: tRNA intron endonuclease, putative [Neospora caninum Liverpool]